MGEHNQVVNKALFSPPLSPKFSKTSSNNPQNFQPQLHTPEVANNKKRLAPISPGNTSQNSEGGSSSGAASMDDLIGKVEEMVKMLKKVGKKKELVSDPLLGCFVAAQTVLMACTAELMRRPKKKAKAQPLDHQLSDGSIDYSSITDGAIDGSRDKKKLKKSKSTS